MSDLRLNGPDKINERFWNAQTRYTVETGLEDVWPGPCGEESGKSADLNDMNTRGGGGGGH